MDTVGDFLTVIRNGVKAGHEKVDVPNSKQKEAIAEVLRKTDYISSFKVVLPPKPIAAAFTRIIQPMLDRIHSNLHESRALANLRDALLPKLLSGELSMNS